MKLLVVSDLHLYNYPSYNLKFDNDIPSRLTNYLKLADILAGHAADHDAVIISGDFYHAATLRPMVLNIGEEFMERLTKAGKPIYIIPGQHEIDEKTSSLEEKNVLIRTLSKVKNVRYYHNQVVNLCLDPQDMTDLSIKAYFLGWESSIRSADSMPDADLFIGHNMVGTASNAFGHVFTSGFDAKELSKKYKLSIIGDIHKSQILCGNVLIPGTPIQHSFSDPEVCGCWSVEVTPKSGILRQECTVQAPVFIPIDDPDFPKFKTVKDDSEVVPTSNVYYKVKPSIAASQKKIKSNGGSSGIDLKSLTVQVCDGLGVENQEEIRSKALSLLDEIQSTTSTSSLPPAYLTGVSIRNFGSIERFTIDFHDDSKILIQGKVGTGKSTLLKAVSWCLYGHVEGIKSSDHLMPSTFKFDKTIVCVTLKLRGETFHILRTLSPKRDGNTLSIYKIDGAAKSEIKKSSMRETQKFIDELLGMDYDDFSTLCLYAQKRSSFFGSMTSSYQTNLLMKFLGGIEEVLKTLGSKVKEKLNVASSKVSMSAGSKATMQSQRITYAQRLESLTQLSLSDDMIRAKLGKIGIAVTLPDTEWGLALLKSGTPLKEALDQVAITLNGSSFKIVGVSDYASLISVRDAYGQAITNCSNIMSEAGHQRQVLALEYKSTKREIEENDGRVEGLEKNICWTCRRPLDTPPNEKEIKKLHKTIAELKTKLKEIETSGKNAKNKAESLEKKQIELNETYANLNALISCVERFEALYNEVHQDVSGEVKELQRLITELDSSIEAEGKKLVDLNTEAEEWKLIKDRVFSNKGIFSHALVSVGSLLSDYMNQILKNAGSDIRVKINTVTWNKSGTPSSKLEIVVKFGPGKELEYPQLSGGQSMLVDALSIVGFYNVLSEKHQLDYGLLGFVALDEIIQFVDDQYVDVLKSILNELRARVTLLISHNPQLAQVFPSKIGVKMENDKSIYELGGL